MVRNRIIYASQSVIADGSFLYRVQTLGSNSTFTSEDVFQLGELNVIDVVDDVPTVAVTCDTNDWGSIHTAAALAGVSQHNFHLSTTSDNANLTVDSGTVSNVSYYHGVALADYGLTTGQINMWAPVQTESSIGTTNDNIDQTLFLRDCYVNSIEWSYSTGANATENYALESDSKMWLLNDARFVTHEEWVFTTAASGTIELGLDDVTGIIPTLSDQKLGFMLRADNGNPGLKIYDVGTDVWTSYEILNGDAATATQASYNSADHVITLPTGFTSANGDKAQVIYCANEYGTASEATSASTYICANYFTGADTFRNVAGSAPEGLGALRQGQAELFLIDPDLAPSDYTLSLRVSSATVSAALTREPQNELGHLKPYARTVTFPVEVTSTVETTASDLEMFARLSGKYTEFAATTLDDISIDDLLSKDNMILVVMVYEQTDEEAGGTYDGRILKSTSTLIGKEYFVEGQVYTYEVGDREYPVKTLIVPGLKATAENFNLAVGSNATQTFDFRSTNKVFCVQGFVPIAHVLASPGFEKNA